MVRASISLSTPFSIIKCLFSKIRPEEQSIQHIGTTVAAIKRAFGCFSSTMTHFVRYHFDFKVFTLALQPLAVH